MVVMSPASARLRLVLATLKSMDNKSLTFFPACLAYMLLLDSVPLTTRRFTTVSLDDKTELAITEFIDQLCQNIDSWTVKEAVDSSLVDVLDGRMFRQVLRHLMHNLQSAEYLVPSAQTAESTDELWRYSRNMSSSVDLKREYMEICGMFSEGVVG